MDWFIVHGFDVDEDTMVTLQPWHFTIARVRLPQYRCGTARRSAFIRVTPVMPNEYPTIHTDIVAGYRERERGISIFVFPSLVNEEPTTTKHCLTLSDLSILRLCRGCMHIDTQLACHGPYRFHCLLLRNQTGSLAGRSTFLLLTKTRLGMLPNRDVMRNTTR